MDLTRYQVEFMAVAVVAASAVVALMAAKYVMRNDRAVREQQSANGKRRPG